MSKLPPFPVVQLADLVEILDNLRVPINGTERLGRIGTVPYYGANGFQGWIDRPLFNEPLILLAEDGGNFDEFATRPIAYRIDGPAWVNNHAHIIRAKAGVCQNFIFWSIVNKDIRKYIAGGTRTKLTQGELRRIEINCPVENEQKLIAKILDTLDTAIHETEAIIAKLKAVKQGLLHDLLTRGIAANGELRPPQTEAPHLYQQSPLGWIPKEWALKPLGHILAEPTKNGLYKPSQFHGRGPLMVQMGGLFEGDAATFRTATRVQVTPFEFNTFGLSEGDLLFARRSLVFEGAGQCVLVRNLTEPATFESSIVRVRVRQNEARPEFVCQFLRGHRSSAQRRRLIRQVAVSGVSGADIRELLIVLPSLKEQGWVISRLEKMQARIDLELASVAKLRSQKSALMDDLLTGRVRVTPLLEAAAP